MAVMYSVNFVWYDVGNQMTYACVKILQGKGKQKAYKEKTVEQYGLVKPKTMAVGSQWLKRVVCIHNKDHFMNLKEFLDVN